MTICVAAIAENSIVVGASDRMLTAGDVEFEPEQSKIWCFSPSLVALVSGDATIQGGLLSLVHKQVQTWINADPNKWVNVRDVATLYSKYYRESLRVHAEADILAPFGLDTSSFLSPQSRIRREIVADIAERLAVYDFSTVQETIFLGLDTDGPVSPKGEPLVYPQIYATHGAYVSKMNSVGFVAIGVGKSHAESHLMFSGHSQHKSFEETLLATMTAKKRAEVAPGVGKFTDVVLVGPGLGVIEKVQDKHVKELEGIYRQIHDSSARSLKEALKKTQLFVARVRTEREKTQQGITKKKRNLKPSVARKSVREP